MDMLETSEYKETLLDELRLQHRKFAKEIILKLKYSYRLYESEPYPTEFSIATLEICDAVCAISYFFRCHYRQVYYYLHNELIDPEEYEKYCFSLPVARSKRYTFNFLFRISFIFEMTMYLFKEGYDYFNIARKCIEEYPDLLYFDASGGWTRLNEISSFVLYLTKPKEVDIAVEHPLLGTFIETVKSVPTKNMNRLSRESIEIQISDIEKEFFNPKEMQSLKLLHKHFVASRTPKCKYKTADLFKIHETFPISNRVPFQIEKESDMHYYIIYDLYIEKREIIFYFRSYIDPEILERYFPLKTSPDSPDEMNYKEESLVNNSECFTCNFSNEEIEEALSKLDSQKESLSHEYDKKKDNFRDIPEYFDSDTSNDLVLHEYDSRKVSENLDNESGHCTELLHEEDSEIPQSIYTNSETLTAENSHDTENKDIDECTQSSDEKIPLLSIPDMPRNKKLDLIKLILDVSRFTKEQREDFIDGLPTNECLQCFDQSLLNNICVSVPHAPDVKTTELKDILKNISYISMATKYILFKIIGNCSGLPTEERNGLLRLLIALPNNVLAEKANLVQVINNMNECPDQVKSDLIQCVIDLTDDECGELREHTYNSMRTVNNFEGVFENIEEVTKEFERFEMLCNTESELDVDKLQEFTVPLVATELSKKMVEESQVEMWLDSSTTSTCQETNKSLKNPEAQDENKFETDNIASGTSMSATSKSLDNFCQKSEVPNPPQTRQRCKTSKKSKKRSRK